MDAVTQARELIRIVASDTEMPGFVRRHARELEPLAATKPPLVCDELEELRQQVLPNLSWESPTCDYARCVPVDVFWEHNLNIERRADFPTADEYRRWLVREPDPAVAAFRDLSPGDLVPAAHSWLVPVTRIADLSGRSLKSRLRLTGHDPPCLVFVLPIAKLRSAGVLVREPRGVDAVPSRLVQWVPGDVPDERIDQDIPLAALGDILWRP